MAVTQSTDIFYPEILTDAVRSKMRGKNALIGSILVSSGAIAVSGQMPESGPQSIGKTVRMPYWGRLGRFQSNAEGSSATPQKVQQGYEDATVARASLAFEVSRWARGVVGVQGSSDDPYDVSANQVVEEAEREMDRQMVAEGSTSPLLASHYSSTAPEYMTYSKVVTDKAIKLGDEQNDGIVAMVTHSLVLADMANEKDASGRPLLTVPQDGTVLRIAGVPVLQSDNVPLTGSTMGTVSEAGASVGNVALTGTPNGPWDLRIDIVTGGGRGTATFRFSTDGGTTWSETLTTAATVALTDTTTDSLVGKDGETGLTATFGDATYNALSVYSSKANLCVESQIWMPGAGAYWYNEQALELLTDKDILEDTDIAAMHLYACPHVYRKRNGGSRPGVLRIKTNVRGFTG